MIVSVLICLLLLANPLQAQNLLAAPGFEAGESDAMPWVLDWYTEEHGVLRIGSEKTHSGAASLHCAITDPGQFAHWRQEGLPIPEGEKYLKLSAWCRAEQVDGAIATIGVTFHDADGYWIDHRLWMVVVVEEGPWRQYEGYVAIPPGMATMNVVGWVNYNEAGTGHFWFDDVQLTPSATMALPEIVFRDVGELPTPTDAERDRGFILFSRDYTRVVPSGAIPRSGERVERLTIRAAQGEREPAVLAVHALNELNEVQVTVGALELVEGAIADIDVRSVRFHSRAGEPRSGPFNETVMRDAPLFLEKRDGVRVQAGASQPFWITLDIPPDAAPGRYEAPVTVRIGNEPAAEIALEVVVLPFGLDSPDNATFAMYTRFREDQQWVDETFADMRDHGLTSVGLMGNFGVPMAIEAGKPVVGWTGVTMFERNLEAYVRAGFPKPVLWLMGGDIRQFCQQQGDIGSQAFADCYAGVMSEIVRHGENEGWPELIVQPIDEPYDHLERLPEALRLLEILKTVPGVRTEMDGMNSAWGRFTDHAFSLMDVLVLHDGPVLERGRIQEKRWEAFLQKANEAGKEIWFYNIDLSAWRPEPLRFMYGFGLWKSGASGVVQWSYMSAVSTDDPGAVYGRDDALIYRFPTAEGESGGPTIAYEAIREGIDDYGYLVTLKNLIIEAQNSASSEWRQLADALWQPIARKIDDATFGGSAGRAAQGDWTGPLRIGEDGTRFVAGEHKLNNNWQLSNYSALRRQIAEAIGVLQKNRPEPVP